MQMHSLSQEDAGELIGFLRAKLKESRYRDLEGPISAEIRFIDSHMDRLKVFIRMLVGMVSERSTHKVGQIENTLRAVLETASGAFEGVQVKLSDSEASLYGIETFSLRDLDKSERFIRAMQDFLERLDFDPSPGPGESSSGPGTDNFPGTSMGA